ncbi:MAG TPA: hypothetical protein VJ521_03505, partial [Acidobacteriota bacterium]|nr:hypothetical protein [Acidobacteriota bacterium]
RKVDAAAEARLAEDQAKLKKIEKNLSLVNRLAEFASVGYEETYGACAKLEEQLEKIGPREEIAGQIDLQASERAKLQSYKQLHSETKAAIQGTVAAIDKAQAKLKQIHDRIGHSSALLTELKERGLAFLKQNKDIDSCPLCGTPMSPEVLKGRINAIAVEPNSADVALTFREIEDLKARLSQSGAVMTQLDLLREFFQFEKTSTEWEMAKIKDLIAAVTKFRSSYAELQASASAAHKQLSKLRGRGYEEEEYKRIRALAKEAFPKLTDYTPERIVATRRTLETDAEQAHARIAELDKKITKERASIDRLLAKYLSNTYSPETISTLASRADILNEAKAHEKTITRYLEIRPSISLRTIAKDVTSVSKTANEILANSRSRKARNVEETKAAERLERINKELSIYVEREARCKRAIELFTDLVEKDNEEKALAEFINANSANINLIFGRLHAPRDFTEVVIEEGEISLRRADAKSATIHEMSSGQRAALALSIFFALNAKLSAAPPVLLIDDPVAHVDDLNTLSFLDYLGDLAIGGKRQIFFATANDRLATLFEQKFDFLSNEFAKFSLDRQTVVGIG